MASSWLHNNNIIMTAIIRTKKKPSTKYITKAGINNIVYFSRYPWSDRRHVIIILQRNI